MRYLRAMFVVAIAWLVASRLMSESAREMIWGRSALAQGPINSDGSYAPNNYGSRPLPHSLGAPMAPVTSSRPANWPGGPGEQVRYDAAATRPGGVLDPLIAALPPVMTPSGIIIDATTIVARVGSEVVQGVDVLPAVDEMILKNVAKAKASAGDNAAPPSPEYLGKVRGEWLRQSLAEAVKTKLLYGEAKHSIPAENLPKVEDQINKVFNAEQSKKLMELYKVETRAELETKLRSFGSSYEAKKRQFFETNLAYSWLRQQVKLDAEITHEDMLKYYHDHLADYENPAKVRWEHISVNFERHQAKDEMFRLICEWGNLIFSGAPFADVAKAHSEDFSASDGGMNDWTSKGNLASPVIDDALFSLPVGRLSQILEDNRGFHIVRVVERKDASRTSFTECQDGIKKKIKDHKSDTQMKEYLAQIEAKVPVWTIFDPPAEVAAPAAAGSPVVSSPPGIAPPAYGAQAPSDPRR